MFDFVRQHTRLALGFMLLLIIPSFVFFGVQGYSSFNDGANASIAKVDGHGITRAEWDDAHKRVIDNVRRQSQGADTSQYDTPTFRRETLDSLVRERVLLAAANKLHLYPSAGRMNRLFDADPQFAGLRGPDGKISRELLAMQGMTPELFDQRLRQDFAVRQVAGGIVQSVPLSASVATASLDAFMQRRAVQLQRFDPLAYRDKVSTTDAEIEAFYKAHAAEFSAPEQASIDYVVLDLDTLGKTETLSEADLRKAYADNAARYGTPEERRASHILIKADKDAGAEQRSKARARAETLLAEARKNPAGFAELARKNSEDGSAAQGGDLDFFGRGSMVKPFEDSVFALKSGQISDVVETDFGYHVIMLTAVRGGESKPFEQVRGEVEAELRKARAQARWADTAEQFTNTVYEQSDSLEPAISKLKLQKQSATVQRVAAPGATGPLASSKLLDAVFSSDAINNKRNTDAVEVAPHQIVSARIVKHSPARALPLAEVKDHVRERVITEQSALLARKDGEARLAALRAGDATVLPVALTVARNQAQGMPRKLLEAVLHADASRLPALEGVDLGEQGYIVLRVLQVLPRDTPPGGDEALRAQYAQAWGAAEAAAYVEALKKRFKAQISPAADSAAAEPASGPVR